MQNTQRNEESNVSAQNVVDMINKRGGSQVSEPQLFRIMMSVVKSESYDDHFWAVGYRLGGSVVQRKPREMIAVRLNTVEERVSDMQMFSSESKATLTNKIKVDYVTGGHKTRKTLQKHLSGHTRLLSFERVVYLYTKDNVKHYRAHWPSAMSTDPNAHFIQGMGHIKIIPGNDKLGRKPIVQAEIIESMMLDASREDSEKNNVLIAKALNHQDPTSHLDTAVRTGKLMVEMVVNGQRNTRTIDIYNEKADFLVPSNSGGQTTVRKSIPYADTIQAYLTGSDYHSSRYKEDPNNSYKRDKAYEADINRHILAYLLNIPAKDIPILREDVADTVIKPFVNNLYRKEITLNIFAVRVYYFGKSFEDLTIGRSQAFGLHKKYVVAIKETGDIIPYHEADGLPATPAYTPTAIAVQRYPDGTAYVVFEGAVNINKENFILSSSIEPEMVDKYKDFYGTIHKN